MCVFFCLDKNEISFIFLRKAFTYASNDKLYDKNSNILMDMVFVMNSLSGLLLVYLQCIQYHQKQDKVTTDRTTEKIIFYPNSKQETLSPLNVKLFKNTYNKHGTIFPKQLMCVYDAENNYKCSVFDVLKSQFLSNINS